MSAGRDFVIVGTALLWGLAHGALLASPPSAEPRFPSIGMPYEQAKELLLKQGFRVARDPRPLVPQLPDHRHSEINCGGQRPTCEALFLYRWPNGWQEYAVVLVKPDTLQIVVAEWRSPADGLKSIPPPGAPDVPKLKGYYFSARKHLRALGFAPLKMRWPSKTCASSKLPCKRLVVMLEANCTSDTAECVSFWRASGGRVLKVQTVGEVFGGRIYFVNWSTQREQQEMSEYRENRGQSKN